MAAAPAYATVSGYATPKSDDDTLSMYTPADAAQQAHEDHLSQHPLVASLRANPAFAESRPHLKIPAAWRAHNLTAGTLMGADRVPFPPVAWLDAEGDRKEFVQISYVGPELCGHPGIVHGGYLATVLDEGLGRTAFAALPHHVGLTANLNVNYKAPCMAGQYIVLRSELTKGEGRKAWVEGRIETLPEGDEKPVVLAEATALFIEPKQAAVSIWSLDLHLGMAANFFSGSFEELLCYLRRHDGHGSHLLQTYCMIFDAPVDTGVWADGGLRTILWILGI